VRARSLNGLRPVDKERHAELCEMERALPGRPLGLEPEGSPERHQFDLVSVCLAPALKRGKCVRRLGDHCLEEVHDGLSDQFERSVIGNATHQPQCDGG